MNSGGSGDWRSRGNREAIPQPINQAPNVGRLDIFVDEASNVQLPEGGRSTDRHTKEVSQFHGYSQQSIERLASWILEDEDRSSLVLRELKRSNCPRRIQLSPQGELVLHYPDSLGSRLFRSGRFYENRAPMRSRTRSLTATRKDKVTIAMEGVESIVR